MSETNNLCQKLGNEHKFNALLEEMNQQRAQTEEHKYTAFVRGVFFGAVITIAAIGAGLMISDAMARASHDIAMVWG